MLSLECVRTQDTDENVLEVPSSDPIEKLMVNHFAGDSRTDTSSSCKEEKCTNASAGAEQCPEVDECGYTSCDAACAHAEMTYFDTRGRNVTYFFMMNPNEGPQSATAELRRSRPKGFIFT